MKNNDNNNSAPPHWMPTYRHEVPNTYYATIASQNYSLYWHRGWKCPLCGTPALYSQAAISFQSAYCPSCGKRLERTEENEYRHCFVIDKAEEAAWREENREIIVYDFQVSKETAAL